jgi:dihydrofolate reductase
VTLTAQDPSQVVEALGARGFSRAWLMGGGELASAFRLRGLISQYVISVIPVVLGRGVPLFASAARSDSLRLIETKSFPSGIVQLSYAKGMEAQ